MKSLIILFLFLSCLSNSYAQIELHELENKSKQNEISSQKDPLSNIQNFSPDTTAVILQTAALGVHENDLQKSITQLKEDMDETAQSVKELKKNLKSLQEQKDNDKKLSDAQNIELQKKIDEATKTLSDQKMLIDEKTKLYNSAIENIKQLQLALYTTIYNQLNIKIDSLSKTLESLKNENSGLYKIEIYKDLYQIDSGDIHTINYFKIEENNLLIYYKTILDQMIKNIGVYEELLSTYSNSKESVTLPPLDSLQKSISEKNSEINKIIVEIKTKRHSFKSIIEHTTKNESNETATDGADLSPMFSALSTVTNSTIQPNFTLSGRLALNSQQAKIANGFDVNIFAASPQQFNKDSTSYNDIYKAVSQALFVPERSNLGIKVSYAFKWDAILSSTKLKSASSINEPVLGVGFTIASYYETKTIPVTDSVLSTFSTINGGFLHTKTGIGFTVFNDIFVIYLNGNYLQPVTGIKEFENYFQQSSDPILYFDSGISTLLKLDQESPVNARMAINFILSNGQINGINSNSDKVIPTLTLGLNFKPVQKEASK